MNDSSLRRDFVNKRIIYKIMAKSSNDEEVSMNTLLYICEYFDRKFGDISSAPMTNEMKKNLEETQ